jgi:hypothetical protein
MTVGLSPKFKLAALLGTVATAIVVLLAVLFPHAVTSEVAAALAAFIATVSTAFGAYQGEPGEVVVQPGQPSDTVLSPTATANLEAIRPEDPKDV